MQPASLRLPGACAALLISLCAQAEPPAQVSGVINFHGRLVVGQCNLPSTYLAALAQGRSVPRQQFDPALPCMGVSNHPAVTARVVRLADASSRLIVITYE